MKSLESLEQDKDQSMRYHLLSSHKENCLQSLMYMNIELYIYMIQANIQEQNEQIIHKITPLHAIFINIQ